MDEPEIHVKGFLLEIFLFVRKGKFAIQDELAPSMQFFRPHIPRPGHLAHTLLSRTKGTKC